MRYIDLNYYRSTFKNGTAEPVADDDLLNYYIDAASEDIDDLTFNRIVDIGFDSLTSFEQDKIKLATAYQVENIVVNGDDGESTIADDKNGFRLGDLTVSGGKDIVSTTETRVSKRTLMALKKTRLTDRNFRYNRVNWQNLDCGC